MSDLPIPHDREEIILNAMATGEAIDCPEPHTRKEIYLKEIYENGGGSGGSGVTPAQVESIIAAKTDSSLSDTSTNPVQNKVVKEAIDECVKAEEGKVLVDTEDVAQITANKNALYILNGAAEGSVQKTVNDAIVNKVDKVTGKGLSSNDYDDEAVAEVAKVANKVDKVDGKGLSTNDYSDTEKAKVAKNVTDISTLRYDADTMLAVVEGLSGDISNLSSDVENNTNIVNASTVSSMADTDKVYVNTGNNIKQITKDNLLLTELSFSIIRDYYVVKQNGEITKYSGWSMTEYIDVSRFSKLTFTNVLYTSDYNVFYTADKTYISNFTLTEGQTTEVTIPSNAKYMIVSSNTPTMNAIKILGLANYVIKENGDKVTDINSSMSDYGLNNVFDGELLAGYYNDSIVYTSDTNDRYVCSKKYYPISANQTVRIKYNGTLERGNIANTTIEIIFLDSSKAKISSATVNNKVTEILATSPSGSSYFVFNFFNDVSGHSTLSPTSHNHIGVYVNNQIDVITSNKGTVAINTTASNASQGGVNWYLHDGSVAFGKTFSKAPNVYLTPLGVGGNACFPMVVSVTTTSFTYRIWSASKINGGNLQWFAIE